MESEDELEQPTTEPTTPVGGESKKKSGLAWRERIASASSVGSARVGSMMNVVGGKRKKKTVTQLFDKIGTRGDGDFEDIEGMYDGRTQLQVTCHPSSDVPVIMAIQVLQKETHAKVLVVQRSIAFLGRRDEFKLFDEIMNDVISASIEENVKFERLRYCPFVVRPIGTATRDQTHIDMNERFRSASGSISNYTELVETIDVRTEYCNMGRLSDNMALLFAVRGNASLRLKAMTQITLGVSSIHACGFHHGCLGLASVQANSVQDNEDEPVQYNFKVDFLTPAHMFGSHRNATKYAQLETVFEAEYHSLMRDMRASAARGRLSSGFDHDKFCLGILFALLCADIPPTNENGQLIRDLVGDNSVVLDFAQVSAIKNLLCDHPVELGLIHVLTRTSGDIAQTRIHDVVEFLKNVQVQPETNRLYYSGRPDFDSVVEYFDNGEELKLDGPGARHGAIKVMNIDNDMKEADDDPRISAPADVVDDLFGDDDDDDDESQSDNKEREEEVDDDTKKEDMIEIVSNDDDDNDKDGEGEDEEDDDEEEGDDDNEWWERYKMSLVGFDFDDGVMEFIEYHAKRVGFSLRKWEDQRTKVWQYASLALKIGIGCALLVLIIFLAIQASNNRANVSHTAVLGTISLSFVVSLFASLIVIPMAIMLGSAHWVAACVLFSLIHLIFVWIVAVTFRIPLEQGWGVMMAIQKTFLFREFYRFAKIDRKLCGVILKQLNLRLVFVDFRTTCLTMLLVLLIQFVVAVVGAYGFISFNIFSSWGSLFLFYGFVWLLNVPRIMFHFILARDIRMHYTVSKSARPFRDGCTAAVWNRPFDLTVVTLLVSTNPIWYFWMNFCVAARGILDCCRGGVCECLYHIVDAIQNACSKLLQVTSKNIVTIISLGNTTLRQAIKLNRESIRDADILFVGEGRAQSDNSALTYVTNNCVLIGAISYLWGGVFGAVVGYSAARTVWEFLDVFLQISEVAWMICPDVLHSIDNDLIRYRQERNQEYLEALSTERQNQENDNAVVPAQHSVDLHVAATDDFQVHVDPNAVAVQHESRGAVMTEHAVYAEANTTQAVLVGPMVQNDSQA